MPEDPMKPKDLYYSTSTSSPDARPLHNTTGDMSRSGDPDILPEPDSPPPHQHLGSAALAKTDSTPGEEPSEGRDGSDIVNTGERAASTPELSSQTTGDWQRTLRHLEPLARKTETISTGRPHREAGASRPTFDIQCHKTTTDNPEASPRYGVTLDVRNGDTIQHYSSETPTSGDDNMAIMMKAHDIKQELPGVHGEWVEEATQRLLMKDHPFARSIEQLIQASPYAQNVRTEHTLTDYRCDDGSIISAQWDTTTHTGKLPYDEPITTTGNQWMRLDCPDGTHAYAHFTTEGEQNVHIDTYNRDHPETPHDTDDHALHQLSSGQAAATDASLARMTELVREATGYQEAQPPTPDTIPPDPATKYTLDTLLEALSQRRLFLGETTTTGVVADNDRGDFVDIQCISETGNDPQASPVVRVTLSVGSSDKEVDVYNAVSGEPRTPGEPRVIADAIATLQRGAATARARQWFEDAHSLLVNDDTMPSRTTPERLLREAPFDTVTEKKYYVQGQTPRNATVTRAWTEVSTDPPLVRETSDGSGVWQQVPEPQIFYNSLRVELPDRRVFLYAHLGDQRHIHTLSPQERRSGSGYTTEVQEVENFGRRVQTGNCRATQASMTQLIHVLQNDL
jgi:hypothetical protein